MLIRRTLRAVAPLTIIASAISVGYSPTAMAQQVDPELDNAIAAAREHDRAEDAAAAAADQAKAHIQQTQSAAFEAQYARDLAIFRASFAHRKVLGDYVCGSSPMIGIAVIGQVEQVKGNLIQVRESVPSTQGSAYYQGTPGYDHLEWIKMNSVGLCRARTRLFIVHECQNMMGGLGNLISPLCQMTADFSSDH